MELVGKVDQLKSSAYLGMVTKLAWKTWQQLPPHTRAWIAIEDMVLDGLRWVEMSGFQRWNRKRGALSTILYCGVQNYYYDHYLVRFAITQKSREQRVMSIQDREQQLQEQGKTFDFERAFGIRVPTQNEVEQQFLNCMAAENMVHLYYAAAGPLRDKIHDWFLGHAEWRKKDVKWYTGTPEFKRQARKFRQLASVQGVTIGECRHLLSSPPCLDKLSQEITRLPYSLMG